MKEKTIFYMVLFLVGNLVLLLNQDFIQSLIVRSIGPLILAILGALIYFDKGYRNRYIPSIPSWFLVSAIVWCLGVSVYLFIE